LKLLALDRRSWEDFWGFEKDLERILRCRKERTLGEFSRFIGGILGILSRVLTFFRKKGARMGWAGWMRKEEGGRVKG